MPVYRGSDEGKLESLPLIAANTLVIENFDLVKLVAHSMKQRVSHRADIDDLTSDAQLGLVEASRKWHPGSGNFRGFAVIVMRRRMVDGIRQRWGKRFRQQPLSIEYESVREGLVSKRGDPVKTLEDRERFLDLVLSQEPNQGKPKTHVLSENEFDVLAGAALGETASETADRRHRSVETIKSQRKLVLHKLGARDMANAVYLAIRDGLLVPEGVGKPIQLIGEVDDGGSPPAPLVIPDSPGGADS